jgi:hypothetical protein
VEEARNPAGNDVGRERSCHLHQPVEGLADEVEENMVGKAHGIVGANIPGVRDLHGGSLHRPALAIMDGSSDR